MKLSGGNVVPNRAFRGDAPRAITGTFFSISIDGRVKGEREGHPIELLISPAHVQV